jgi:hypothetical protein
MQSISEAFNKCFVADLIFSVSRTADDKQTEEFILQKIEMGLMD